MQFEPHKNWPRSVLPQSSFCSQDAATSRAGRGEEAQVWLTHPSTPTHPRHAQQRPPLRYLGKVNSEGPALINESPTRKE
ncbi:hypothetical protein E2C01_047828 [Portunus trituberculatus]|uniref:Uncharacterized protein n=1 Tax=Portunus trituberculatus TaxID=210409 RepID=A0A5B7G8X2_PORTR|nr:hypothetical protein [Portunus trituberculatus]